MRFFLGLLALATLTLADSFVDDPASDEGFMRRQNRKLLQDREEEEDDSRPLEQRGPEMFFDTDFFLQVDKGIVVHVYDNDKKGGLVDKIVLSRRAISVKGSYVNSNRSEMSVSLDWKALDFPSEMRRIDLDGIILKMTFQRKKKEFRLTKIQADQMVMGNSNNRDLDVRVKSRSGFEVSAPIGMAFDCSEMGIFPPKPSEASKSNKYSIGLSFPNMRLQVFDLKEQKFGPSWGCGEFLSIGVWVGLIVSLFFALICMWGFSMLANIQTMDRFDDPKGKPIHVPQAE